MSKTLKINGGTVVAVSTIRSIRPITDEERTRMAERYGKPEADFADKAITLQFADKSSRTAELTLDEVRGQGVGLVNLGADRFVPADNIKSAAALTKDDLAKMAEKGMTLSQTFRSRVETTAGTLLSSATPAQVIERAEKAKATAGQPAAGQGAGAARPKTPANG